MLPRSILVKRGYVSSSLPMRYARAVKRRPLIEVPSAQGDELPLRSLMATSAACLALGLALAYGLAEREAPRAAATEPTELAPSAAAGAEEASPVAMVEPAPEPPPRPTAAVAIEAPGAGAALAAGIEPVSAIGAPDAAIASEPAISERPQPSAAEHDAPIPEPAARSAEAIAANAPQEPHAPAQPAGSSRRLHVKPGVFAYLRCEGVPQRRGKYPCPRDRALEGRMRTIIEALPTCREAHSIPRGRSFEVRLELGAGGTFKELQVNGPNEAAERAVRACAGPALRKERTELRPTRMIVSMRFKAR